MASGVYTQTHILLRIESDFKKPGTRLVLKVLFSLVNFKDKSVTKLHNNVICNFPVTFILKVTSNT